MRSHTHTHAPTQHPTLTGNMLAGGWCTRNRPRLQTCAAAAKLASFRKNMSLQVREARADSKTVRVCVRACMRVACAQDDELPNHACESTLCAWLQDPVPEPVVDLQPTPTVAEVEKAFEKELEGGFTLHCINDGPMPQRPFRHQDTAAS